MPQQFFRSDLQSGFANLGSQLGAIPGQVVAAGEQQRQWDMLQQQLQDREGTIARIKSELLEKYPNYSNSINRIGVDSKQSTTDILTNSAAFEINMQNYERLKQQYPDRNFMAPYYGLTPEKYNALNSDQAVKARQEYVNEQVGRATGRLPEQRTGIQGPVQQGQAPLGVEGRPTYPGAPFQQEPATTQQQVAPVLQSQFGGVGDITQQEFERSPAFSALPQEMTETERARIRSLDALANKREAGESKTDTDYWNDQYDFLRRWGDAAIRAQANFARQKKDGLTSSSDVRKMVQLDVEANDISQAADILAKARAKGQRIDASKALDLARKHNQKEIDEALEALISSLPEGNKGFTVPGAVPLLGGKTFGGLSPNEMFERQIFEGARSQPKSKYSNITTE